MRIRDGDAPAVWPSAPRLPTRRARSRRAQCCRTMTRNIGSRP